MILLQVLFFFAATLLVVHYIAYPAFVVLFARRRSVELSRSDSLPTVTVVIAAYNEERVIAGKIENTLALDYPKDLLRVIVAADGSSDCTAEIARRYAANGVAVLHQIERRGKTAALNRSVAAAQSDIVVFSDANNHFNADALRMLVRHFADPRVGGVCGVKHIFAAADRESSVGDGLYWRYESAIKLAESRLGSITTADGEIFAVRRSLYQPVDESLINDDAAITLNLIQAGYRVLYEPGARSFEQASIRIEDDFHVKVRMVSGGFQTLARYRRFLLPPRNAFTTAFFAHKVLRWLAPELLILLAVSSLLLTTSPFFLLMAALQGAFYALAICAWLLRRRTRLPILLYVPFYFCAMNLAALVGLFRYLRRTQTTQWRKAER